MSRQFVGLHADPWVSALRNFLADCDGSPAQEQAARLREARSLLTCAPPGLAEWRGGLPKESLLEAMIAAQAFESASLALLPTNSGHLLSRGGNGVSLASIVLDEAEDELTSSGQTPALALLAALALALAGKAEARAPQRGALSAPQGMRLN